MLYHMLGNMVLILGNVHFLGAYLACHFDKYDVPYAFCAQYNSQVYHTILRTRPLYATTFSEIESFLTDHCDEITTVVNLAPMDIPHHTQPDILIQAIFRTTQKIWLWCAHNKKEYIYASSQYTYDGINNHQYKDGLKSPQKLHPSSLLGWAHNAMDLWSARMLATASVKKPTRTLAFKPFNLYGMFKNIAGAGFIDEAFATIKDGQKVSLLRSASPDFDHGEYIRHFLHVDDCAQALAHLITHKRFSSTIVNIAHPEGLTLKKAAQIIAQTLRKPFTPNYINTPDKLGTAHPVERPSIQQLLSFGMPLTFSSLEHRVGQAQEAP